MSKKKEKENYLNEQQIRLKFTKAIKTDNGLNITKDFLFVGLVTGVTFGEIKDRINFKGFFFNSEKYEKEGFHEAKILDGGVEAWKDAGFDLVAA